ncbi:MULTISPECIES: alpha/beta fold hydrolase [unclassified Nocardioides]|uniref:alpha/beta fold hydrolase n=1 Tax=unclassified Nocardioides TaxID=2615069 RepID=UPI000700643C|nr:MULTISPECIES: alpha/beta hydrolase [unclassified Nocardioides]KQY57452.1 bromoperoxidase [Nocardioides sp. Root140]KQZ76182.1 bromoperoxidase [Nocardioides sp. Root151]
MSTEDNEQSTDQGNLHVVDSGGDGRPVVLIHGWPLSGASWAEQLEPLRSAGYRVVTYDRRGFGESGPGDGYDYDRLAGDLDNVLKDLDLQDVTLVGFSMGGGEVARYVASHGEDRLHSVVFAAAVPPYLLKTDDNPDGPLTEEAAAEMRASLESSRDEFFPGFVDQFYSVDGELKVSDDQREQALALCAKSDQDAALGCMDAFGGTDFREDLKKVTVPTLVIHGDKDAIVPFEGSGKRTHEAIENSELVLVEGGPHGLNVSHADEFNRSLLHFLEQ